MPQKPNTAVLLGLFDSVHRGHIKTVEALTKTGAEHKIVYTFELASLDTKGKRVPLISDEKKRELLLKAGADEVVSVDFHSVKGIEPREFVKQVLIDGLGAQVILCGENFRFGKGAMGDTEMLGALCEEAGASAIIIPLERDSEGVISTTRIRAHLEAGEIERANDLLGRRYAIEGDIIHGNALGRDMGVRTINTAYDGCLRNGVYATSVIIDGRKYPSVTNIGTKPTVSNGEKRGAETHILGFDMEVYGNRATVEFIQFYREEQKFPSRDILIETITNDINKRKESAL